MGVVARALQLGFSLLSVCVAATVLAIVLDASIVQGEETTLNLSRGRDFALVVSAVLVVLSLYLSARSWKSLRAEAASDLVAEEAGANVIAREGISDEEEVAVAEGVTNSLPADEFRLYHMIADSGGEMLQMHIVSSGVFSKAKVTRLLDKLEKKGKVVRERHGMTNRIRILR